MDVFPLIRKIGSRSLLFAFIFICFLADGQQVTRNDAVLSLPICNRKLVIAHCMTNIIRYKGHKFEDSCNPEYFSDKDNITASIGGLTQVLPMEDSLLKNAELDSAVSFEMHAAIASGIDGFQFYYPLGTRPWDEIVKAYFRVADKENIPFYFTFCISHPAGGDEQRRIAEYSARMNDIFDEVGRNNSHWLKTPDGRLILYLWNGDGLADIPAELHGSSRAFYIADAYRKLSDAVSVKFAAVFLINEQISREKLNDYLDYFPACWIWTIPFTGDYIGEMIADECQKRNRCFMGSSFCDFYTSKLLEKGTWNIYSAQDAAKAGTKKGERKYIVTGLSYNFRKLLEFGINKDVSIMNIITWNDYPEGHHLAPEINHNDGFSILLNYYKSTWKKEPSPYADRDLAIVFFKKYNRKTVPRPYNFKVVEIEKGIDPAIEDSVEVVTILRQPAILNVNGHSTTIGGGLNTKRFFIEEGAVKLTVNRDKENVLQFTTPEKITLSPNRTDLLTYSFSSETKRFYKPIFIYQ